MKPSTTESRLRAQIGQRVRSLREAAGLTQTQLGARSGKEQGTISRIESGEYVNITVGVIIDLAYGLGCTPKDIFDWPVGIMDVARFDEGRPQLQAAS